MHKLIKNLTFTFIILFINAVSAMAQQVEMADDFRGEGKIYVVVAVILVILIGIFFYLFRLERKIDKIEKEQGE
jgi:CcmD family protein